MAGSAHVFISYSRKDADLVDRLKAALTDAGVAVWLDHEQLEPGTPDWRAAVLRGIEQATTVIYAASPDAAASKYVGHELAIAEGEGKAILPFWIRGEKWYFCAPMGFYFAQHIDGRDAAWAGGLAKLLATLGVVGNVGSVGSVANLLSQLPTQLQSFPSFKPPESLGGGGPGSRWEARSPCSSWPHWCGEACKP